MRSVAPLSEIELMIGKHCKLIVARIYKLRELVIAYGDAFSWEWQANGWLNITGGGGGGGGSEVGGS